MPATSASRSRASVGRAPGVMIVTGRPSRRSAAASPARTSDDFPLPDGPTTTTTPVVARRSRQAATSASRPKNASASPTSYDTRPRYGQLRLGSGRSVAAANDGSCRRIACSSAMRSGPGSTPSSFAKRARARCNVRSASPCRPERYWASASSAHRSLPKWRRGHQCVRLAQHLAVAPCPQGGVEASLLGLEAQLFEPPRLDASGSHPSRSISARPCHNARDSPITSAARSGSPSVDQLALRARRAARSDAHRRRRSAPPVGSRAAASRLRPLRAVCATA